jgi:hypothetical protein
LGNLLFLRSAKPHNRQFSIQPDGRKIEAIKNSPGLLLGKVAETAVILALFPAVLFWWGLSYYHGFTKELGIDAYYPILKIPFDEAVKGGADTLLMNFAPMVAVVVVLSMFVIGMAEYFRRKQASFSEWTKAFTATSFGVFTIILGAISFGGYQASNLGMNVAHTQIKEPLQVEIMHAEKEVFAGNLYGRIGNDLILKSRSEPQKFTFIKESSIKKVNFILPSQKP